VKIRRYFHTIRPLRPVQIYGRLWFWIHRPKPDLSPAPNLRPRSGEWCAPARSHRSLYSPIAFRFLNEKHELDSPQAWNHPTWEKLWLYNLHYFDDLNAQNAYERHEWHRALIDRWIQENPPTRGNGWEPYPTSLRIVNWIKWALGGNELSESWVRSLAVQTRYLSKRIELHLLGNHLFANAKALVFAGLFFRGPEAAKWLTKGLRLLSNEVSEQVLADGGHFERSPMYHSLILQDLLDLINLMGVYPDAMPDQWRRAAEEWRDTAQRMRRWLEILSHPDGQIAFFNDTALDGAPSPRELDAYAQRMRLGFTEEMDEPVIYLPDSGYIRLQKGPAIALLDVGEIGPDYLPGHAHADTLSFELSLFGQRFLVNSGTSCYGPNPERLRQRSTFSHNTVVVNGQDSSETWGSFRVARRARPFGLKLDNSGDVLRVKCAHDGYRRLPGKPIHWRQWFFQEHELMVHDRIERDFKEATARFHFHPTVVLEAKNSGRSGSARLPDGGRVRWQVLDGVANVQSSAYHPKFGVTEPNRCLEAKFTSPESRIIFRWQ